MQWKIHMQNDEFSNSKMSDDNRIHEKKKFCVLSTLWMSPGIFNFIMFLIQIFTSKIHVSKIIVTLLTVLS